MHKTVYRFGDFELDPKARELRRAGELVAMLPKSFDCLTYLIEHRDRAVGRDELISAVWGRADVSDHLLAQTLLGARRVLGDVGTNERSTIATVSRFGYRWVAALEVCESAPVDAAAESGKSSFEPAPSGPANSSDSIAPVSAAPASNERANPQPSTRRRRPRLLLAAIVVLAVVAMGIAAIRLRLPDAPKSAAAVDTQDAYIVLPVYMADRSDPESAWIRLGGMEYLSAQLRERAALNVLPSNQAIAMDGEERPDTDRGAGDVQRVRSITGATHVITPRAQRSASAWTFEFDVYRGDGLETFSGAGARPLDAVADATRSFLRSRGITLPSKDDAQPELTELLQRVDAAFLKGDLRQARALIDAASPMYRENPELAIRDARVAFRAGQLDAAAVLFESLTADEARIPLSVRARAYMGLGGVAARRGNFAAARPLFSQAIALSEGTGSRTILGTAYMERGNVLHALDEYDAALTDFGRARVEMERSGDRLAIGVLDVNLALVEAGRNRWETALASFDRGIEVGVRYGVDDVLATALLGKTDVQLALADSAGAIASSERFVPLLGRLDNPILLRRLASVRIRALLAAGRIADAERELDAFLSGSASMRGDPQFDLLRVEIRMRRGEFAAASESAEAILARIRRREDPTSEALLTPALCAFVTAAARRGAAAGTLQHWLDQLDTAPPDDSPPWEREFYRTLARAEASPSIDLATPLFSDAFSLADQHGRRDLQVLAGVGHIRRLLHSDGGSAQAVAIVGRLTAIAAHDYRVKLAAADVYRAVGDTELAATALADIASLTREPAAPLVY